ncbi:ligand-binding sensor domain-containing protein, partial [Shewanella sp.]|uniref:ligand-binding sensor domain-containing protein n=1 Tax=Shewanella sp. TaxID=50422 RepID=UPI003F3526B2
MPKALLNCLILTFLLLSTAKAQDLPIALKTESYGVPEGLSQSTVTSVVEDNDGYIWIGTLNGLNRFDGEKFKHFFENDRSGLSSSFIQSLLFDNNTLLIGTDKGLNIYDPELENFKKYPNVNDAIWSINDNGEVYTLSTKDKLIEIKKDNLKIVKTYQNKNFEFIKKAIKTTNGYIVRNHNGKVIHAKDNKDIKIISSTSLDILQSSEDIYIVNADSSYEKLENEFPISKKNHDNYIVISENNVLDIDLSSLKTSNLGSILGKSQILNSQKNYRTTNYIIIPSLNMGFFLIRDSSNIVKSLTNPTGNIWSINKLGVNDGIAISDNSSKIEIYDKELSKIETIDTFITGPKYISKHNDNFLIGSQDGLYLLNNDKKIKILNGNVVSLYKSDNKLIVGTNDYKIHRVNLNTLQVESSFTLNNKHPLFQIIETKDKDILLATQGGLIIINKSGEESFLYDKDFVYCVVETKNAFVFGTRKSIFSIDKLNSKLNQLHYANKPFYSIAIDENDNLSASSINEIILSNNGKLYKLPLEYGSQNEYNTQSGIHLKNYFLFGGISGVSLINTKEITPKLLNKNITTNISELLIFNRTVDLENDILEKSMSRSDNITLKYSDYPFTLKFNSPTSSHKNIEYFYNLNGLSDSWITAKGTNSATFTNLSPGKYTFNVYAENPITKEKGPTKSISIYVSPPWWASFYAISLYLIIFILIIFFIVKAILKKRETQRQIALSEERLKLSLWGSGDEMWDWDIETGNIFRSNIWGALEFPKDGQRA